MKKNKVKKPRTLVNLIGIPTIIFCTYMGGILFNIFISIVILLAMKEFVDIFIDKKIYISKILVSVACFLLFSIRWLSHSDNIVELHLFLILLLMIAAFLVEIFSNKENSIENIGMTLLGFMWIAVSLNYLIDIRNEQGFYFTFAIIISVWACDTFAFFFGSMFGEKKNITYY